MVEESTEPDSCRIPLLPLPAPPSPQPARAPGCRTEADSSHGAAAALSSGGVASSVDEVATSGLGFVVVKDFCVRDDRKLSFLASHSTTCAER